MDPFVRRSHLLVSILKRDEVESSWTHGADAVILDLADSVADADKAAAREFVQESIPAAARGGAEVFVRINKPLVYADVEASLWPGLTGIVLPNVETASEIEDAAAALTEMEARHGVTKGTQQIIVLLDTGLGVWDVCEIITASSRVCSVGLDESNQCRNLGVVPDPDFDPFIYARERIIIQGTAARVQPIGISHPYGSLPCFDVEEQMARLMLRGRNSGFKGTICPHPNWVEPCNRAFTPTEEQVAYHREMRQIFAEAVAMGAAAVPYRDTSRMIDLPVDERARLTIELWERCTPREPEKAAALGKAHS